MWSPAPDGPRSMGRAGPFARGLRRVLPKKLRRRVGQALLPPLAPGLLRALDASWRTTRLHAERHAKVIAEPGRLFVLWHGRMLLPLIEEARRARAKGHEHDLSVLVSPSDDGSIVVPILERFGVRVIRGSTSRGGARALREMLSELKRGGTICLTPDGPRGPRHSTNEGAAWLAKATGFPILPLGCVADPVWRLDTWDDFVIPRPRARVVISYGDTLCVPRDADEAQQAAVTSQMAESLHAAEREGFKLLGREPDW